jgi:hypothetical protein
MSIAAILCFSTVVFAEQISFKGTIISVGLLSERITASSNESSVEIAVQCDGTNDHYGIKYVYVYNYILDYKSAMALGIAAKTNGGKVFFEVTGIKNSSTNFDWWQVRDPGHKILMKIVE